MARTAIISCARPPPFSKIYTPSDEATRARLMGDTFSGCRSFVGSKVGKKVSERRSASNPTQNRGGYFYSLAFFSLVE